MLLWLFGMIVLSKNSLLVDIRDKQDSNLPLADKVRFIMLAFADDGIGGVALFVVVVGGLGGKTGLLT